jgi:hypothetical protein
MLFWYSPFAHFALKRVKRFGSFNAKDESKSGYYFPSPMENLTSTRTTTAAAGSAAQFHAAAGDAAHFQASEQSAARSHCASATAARLSKSVERQCKNGYRYR